ncbi:helicase associated domain-containing protein [Streptomyces sp. NPDC002701]|uniref:helicase associated domain-containing protein n=1 Tax=Streptomyces sp. NPDC002701 TaxID=3364661 RepID=UPI0036B9EB9E
MAALLSADPRPRRLAAPSRSRRASWSSRLRTSAPGSPRSGWGGIGWCLRSSTCWRRSAIEAPAEGEAFAPVRRSQDERWNINLAVARQFHARDGHLSVPRKHVEMITMDGGGEGMQEAVKLGAFIDNSRRRAATLSPERRAALDGLGMRW